MIKYLLCVILIIIATFTGFYFGSKMVRDGIVANYPTIKNLANNSFVEVDTTLVFPITLDETPSLYRLSSITKTDSPLVMVRIHAKYGTNLDSHFFKINKNGNEIEAMLPKTWVLDYTVLSYTTNIKTLSGKELLDVANNDIAPLLPLQLDKIKRFQAAAKNKIATTLMFYFIPYKFDLKIFYDNQELKLPLVVGLNKNVEEYIGEQVGKK